MIYGATTGRAIPLYTIKRKGREIFATSGCYRNDTNSSMLVFKFFNVVSA